MKVIGWEEQPWLWNLRQPGPNLHAELEHYSPSPNWGILDDPFKNDPFIHKMFEDKYKWMGVG